MSLFFRTAPATVKASVFVWRGYLFPVDIRICSGFITHRYHNPFQLAAILKFLAAKKLLRRRTQMMIQGCKRDVPWFFSYEIIRHINLFSDRHSYLSFSLYEVRTTRASRAWSCLLARSTSQTITQFRLTIQSIQTYFMPALVRYNIYSITLKTG
jgi:hypothetical protein